MNHQKPEPRAKGDGESLDLHSIFYTIQGEGPFTGQRSIFIRLAGCNLQCPGCDTEYTNGRKMRKVHEITQHVEMLVREREGPLPLVVITGGEPFRQSIGRLVDLLVTSGFHVQIESNGVLPCCSTVETLVYLGKVTVVVSPKTVRVHECWYDLAGAWKYVLDHREVCANDGLPLRALGHPSGEFGVARPNWRLVQLGRIFVNPYDAGDAAENALNLRAVTDSALAFGYVAGVQMHKLMNVD